MIIIFIVLFIIFIIVYTAIILAYDKEVDNLKKELLQYRQDNINLSVKIEYLKDEITKLKYRYKR